MKLIKLNYEDPELFRMCLVSHTTCDFIVSHFEAFMQMYRTQGSTFWLRFLVTFKCHLEKNISTNEKWLSQLANHFQYIKMFNFVFISLHKKFIEGSNTVVKKLINNLITLTLNSPSHLQYSIKQWSAKINSYKKLLNVYQNLFGISELSHNSTVVAPALTTMYLHFFAVLCQVFKLWLQADDLSEEGVKNLDSKIIYWSPTFFTNKHFKPHCFEKYLSNYWKENLQKMLLKDDVDNLFFSHESTGCCKNFDEEKDSLFADFNEHHITNLIKMLTVNGDSEEEDVQTCSELTLKDIFFLKPQAAVCKSHKKCFVKICHGSNCPEPFICEGRELCKVTCETNLKNDQKENNCEKFWKTISIDVFSVSGKNRDVSTFVESNERQIQTYLHTRKNLGVSISKTMSMLDSEYYHRQSSSKMSDLGLDHRKAECVSRLRKKLNQKRDSDFINPPSLKLPESLEILLQNAQSKMASLELNYCSSTGHHSANCDRKCYNRTLTTVSVSTANAFGRVVFLSKLTAYKLKEKPKKCREPNHIDNSSTGTTKNVPATEDSVDLKKIKNKVVNENLTKSEKSSQKAKKKGSKRNTVASNIPAASGKTNERTYSKNKDGTGKVVKKMQGDSTKVKAVDISVVSSSDRNGLDSPSTIEEKKNSDVCIEDVADYEIFKSIGCIRLSKETIKNVPAVDVSVNLIDKVINENSTKSEKTSKEAKKISSKQSTVSFNLPAASGKVTVSFNLPATSGMVNVSSGSKNKDGTGKIVKKMQGDSTKVKAVDISVVSSNDSNSVNSPNTTEEKKNSCISIEDDEDDDIDEILKLIGIGEAYEVCASKEEVNSSSTSQQQKADDNSILHQQLEKHAAVEHNLN